MGPSSNSCSEPEKFFGLDFIENLVGDGTFVFNLVGRDAGNPDFFADVFDAVLDVFQFQLTLVDRGVRPIRGRPRTGGLVRFPG
jgi:hypothetical protein